MRIKLHNFIDWCYNKAQYITAIILIVLTIIDISDLNEWKIKAFEIENFPIGKIFYYISVIIAFVFGIIAIQSAKEIEKLEKDNEDKGKKIVDLEEAINSIVKDTDDLFNSYLKLLIQNLNFSHNERISVYKVVENKFVLIGRASTNPNLSKKGRNNYPTDEGFIGKGWEEGSFFIDNLPDPTHRNGQTYYNSVSRINKIPKEIVDNINMKSRTYYIHRIDGFDNNPKAVLVFESLSNNAFEENDVRSVIEDVEQPLTMFIEKNNKYKYSQQNGIEL